MGRIKGWKLWDSTPNYWIHTKKVGNIELNTYVNVSQVPPMYRKRNWRVQITSDTSTGVMGRSDLTKIEARKYALNWMKEHPPDKHGNIIL